MHAPEIRAAIQRATDEIDSVIDGLTWPCTDLRPVAGQQLTCVERGPGDPLHWTAASPCVRCRMLMCLQRAHSALQGADNWAESLS